MYITPQQLPVYPDKYIETTEHFNNSFTNKIYGDFTVFILGLKVTMSVVGIMGYLAKSSKV